MAKVRRRRVSKVTKEDLSSYIELKGQESQLKSGIEELRKTFYEYADNVGFEESASIVVSRGEHTITISEVTKQSISKEAQELIETSRKFKRYRECIESVNILNGSLLMDKLIKDIEDGSITEASANELLETATSMRININK